MRFIGHVSDANGSTFKAIAREPVVAYTLEEKAAIQKKKDMFEASVTGSKAGSQASDVYSLEACS